jgi:hypothetical protein
MVFCWAIASFMALICARKSTLALALAGGGDGVAGGGARGGGLSSNRDHVPEDVATRCLGLR